MTVCQALAEARRLPDVKQVRDMAEALRQDVKQQEDSLDIQNQAAEIKLRAERKAGALLADQTQHQGGRKRLHHTTVSLADIDIEKT